MLILSRKADQSVILVVPPSDKPQAIRVEVTEIGTSQVKLGFEADRVVAIHRAEIQQQNSSASGLESGH